VRLIRYILQRLLLLVPVLAGMSIIVFFLLRLVPGDPALVILGLRATPEGIAQIHEDLGLDLPLGEQYVHWVSMFLRGDFGKDYRSNIAVTTLLSERLPVTLELTLLAMTMSLVIAIPLGIRAALHPRGPADVSASLLGLLGISIPDFWLGILLILLLALTFRAFPSSGYVPLSEGLAANIHSLFLPALTLAVGLSAVLVRIARAATVDVLGRDFVRFLRAKGLRERLIIYKHVLRNAAVPIVTVVGLQFGYLLGGAVIVEQVFTLPGIGSLIVNATLERNYPVVQASVLVVALMFILVNLATDVTYAVINPKIREGEA
jgi:peptide/nickel transport system permease protein